MGEPSEIILTKVTSEMYDIPQAPEFVTIIGSRLINKSNIVIQSCITLIFF